MDTMWNCMKKIFTGFCTESSVHGVKYLIKDKNIVSSCLLLGLSIWLLVYESVTSVVIASWLGTQRVPALASRNDAIAMANAVSILNYTCKCYWCFILAFAVFCCAQFTQMLSSRFLDIPVRMVIKNKQALTELTPLPSITFCSENPTTDTWYDQFLDNITLPNNVTRESALEAMRHSVSKVSPRFQQVPISAESELLALVNLILEYNNITPRDFMDRVSVPCHILLQRCQIRGQIRQCGDLFKRVRGQCCTFTDDPKTFHTSGNLFGNSFIVLSTMNYGLAYFVVHEPGSEPLISRSTFTMNNGHYVMFYIDPLRVEKSEEVHEVEEYTGECAHPDDRDLYYFDEYDQSKCLSERAINYSLTLCDCVGTYFPAPDQITCNFSQMNCLLQNPDLKNTRPRSPSTPWDSKIDGAAAKKGIELQDSCPNSCEKTLYRLNFKPRNFLPMHDFTGLLNDIDPKNAYVVHFSYENQFYTIQEFVLITDWITLLSNLGGVYGLFLGCSMLTLAEIFYFLWSTWLRKMWNRLCEPNLK